MRKKGFTLLEVVLFLGLSGVLVLIVIGGTSHSIAEKRYNDTVENFVSYLEDLYSKVNYTRQSSNGTSDKAVYGKLIYMETQDKKTTFSSYTILGNANTRGLADQDALGMLKELTPTALMSSKEEYKPSWGGWINAQETNASSEKSQILLLIIRHPKNGMSYTYVSYPDSPQTITENIYTKASPGVSETGLLSEFSAKTANFCVDSSDRWASNENERRLVRISAKANNASGVELIGNSQKEGGYCAD